MRDSDLESVLEASNATDKREILDILGQVTKQNPLDSPTLEGVTQFLLKIHDYAVKTESGTRSLIFRLVRHCLNDRNTLQALVSTGFQLLVICGLERDHELVLERMQALRIMRKWIELDASTIPRAMVRSIVAVASHHEDGCRRVCLETMRELLVHNPEIVARSNGIRALFEAVLDANTCDMAEPILLSLLFILNDPNTREFIRPYLDWQYLLSPFTELDEVEQQNRLQRWDAAKNAFVVVMRSWVGVIQMTSDPLGLPSLVRLLADPHVSAATQKAVMEAFGDLLEPVVAQSTEEDAEHEGLATIQNRAMWLPSAGRDATKESLIDPVYNLLDNYAALVCSAFLHAGLIQCLCTLATAEDDALASSARKLLVDLLLTIARLFPAHRCSEILAMPEVIEYAASANALKYSNRALKASNVLAALAGAFSINRYVEPSTAEEDEDDPANSKAASADLRSLSEVADELTQTSHSRLSSAAQTRTTRYDMMYELKLAMEVGLDRATFDTQLQRSRVLSTKDCSRWDWGLISDILEYSIRQPQRLSEALRTKWIKRISGFFRCSVEEKGFFAHLAWDPHNLHYLECACNMYNVLVEYEEGRQFLTSDRRGQLFAEIVRELEALVASVTNPAKADIELVLDPTACSQSMAREYFTLVGRLTSTDPGRDLLHSTQLFQHLSALGQHKRLDYISRLALTSLGFTDAGFISRNLLQVWTTSGRCSKELRLYAHTLLRALLRARVDEFEQWGIDVLVTQLQFDDLPTASLISVLEEAAQDRRYLKALILKRPEIFSKPGIDTLLIRFLALPEGLEYLQQLDWFEDALRQWRGDELTAYALRVERALAKSLSETQVRQMQAQPLRPIPFNARTLSSPGSDPNRQPSLAADAGVDLEGLLRAPWNMEVRFSIGGNVATPDKVMTVDCFLDASDIRSPASCEISSDATRLVKVRGIIQNQPVDSVDNHVQPQHTIHTTLLLGGCPVRRTGHLHTFRDADPWRRAPSSFTSAISRRTSVVSYDSRQSFLGALDLDDIHGASPHTLATDPLKDWSVCKTYHRQTEITIDSHSFAVEASGEPVRWIFETNSNGDTNLVEVQYFLQLQLNQPMFAAIPRHFMGELARTANGCAILKDRNIAQDLLTTIFDKAQSSLQRRAALWALGHIGASDLGYQLLEEVDEACIGKILSKAVNSSDYSLRGTAFYVLGLLSRTSCGREMLAAHNWEFSSLNGVAVAVPSDPAILFQRGPGGDFDGSPANFDATGERLPGADPAQLMEDEHAVLLAISKLPGHILNKDSQQQLQKLRRTKPHLFNSRQLYLAVQTLMANYGFKLPLRKGILGMFTHSARCLNPESS